MDQKMEFPEKWPEVLSHRRKSYKSFNLFKTLNLLFFFKKKVESGLQRRETHLTFFFKRMYLFATAKAVSVVLQCFLILLLLKNIYILNYKVSLCKLFLLLISTSLFALCHLLQNVQPPSWSGSSLTSPWHLSKTVWTTVITHINSYTVSGISIGCKLICCVPARSEQTRSLTPFLLHNLFDGVSGFHCSLSSCICSCEPSESWANM